MAKKVFGGAVSAIGAAVDAVRHVAWYVSYKVDGTSKDAEPRP